MFIENTIIDCNYQNEAILLGDFLPRLPEVFRERYLNTHSIYLKSIADVIQVQYYKRNSMKLATMNMIQTLREQRATHKKKRKDSNDETPEFRNLRNCWYHECSINYPYDAIDERLKFASWKIIQCYYSVFASVASIVCCHHEPKKSIDKTLSIYANEFLCNRERKNFFLPPVNLYLNQECKIPDELLERITWEYAHQHKIPYIIDCLKMAHKEKQIISVPHYLKCLRDWVTYQDAYLLFRLYGQGPKEDLDFSLKRIAFIHSLQAENYLIELFGWEAVNQQYDTFFTQLENNIGITSEPLVARFEIFERMNT